jgi:hypothetical protein
MNKTKMTYYTTDNNFELSHTVAATATTTTCV